MGLQTTYTLTALVDGEIYSIAITAVNTAGNESAYSNTITVTATSPNDAPVAMDDIVTTLEDTAVSVAVLANDSDPDGDTLTVTTVTQGTAGRVANNGTAVTYVPTLNFHGSDSFSYTISDGQGGTATAIVSVTVIPSNDAPVAMDDIAVTAEDTAVSVATNGTAVAYTVSDGQQGSATAAVSVTVFVQIALEAESGDLTPPMQPGVDDETPANLYVRVPDGLPDAMDATADSGVARYLVDIPKTDTYVIWGRVTPTADGTGSFYLALDHAAGEEGAVLNIMDQTPAYRLWEIGARGASASWTWDQAALSTDPVFFLDAGVYTLLIKQRQSGPKLDKLLLTNDLDLVPRD